VRDGAPESVRRVSGEIDGLRDELGAIVAELDRRRHELFDLRLQLRRHPTVVVASAGAAALLLGGLLARSVRARRARRRPAARAREARRALVRLLDHPHRVAAEPRVGVKILAAVGTAAGSVLARRAVELLVARARVPRSRTDGVPRAPTLHDELGLGRS
jgi:ElaB/YqjD/DUF883 family membrane-anchored ribosome-binding protein